MNKGQSGPRPKSGLSRENYPLTTRDNELQGETNSPQIYALYNRTQTMENQEASQRGSISESGHEPYRTDWPSHRNVGQSQETWDGNTAPMTEENVRMKYVQLGVNSEDEPFKAGFEQAKY